MFRRHCWTLVCLLLIPLSASAQVPGTLGYVGVLANENGPMNGTADITVSLFSHEIPIEDSAADWSERHTDVLVQDGRFRLNLGSETRFAEGLFLSEGLWLEFTVNDEVMAPRVPMSSVPYALVAATADSARSLEGFDPSAVQPRFSTDCEEGAFIQSIDADGNVTCAADRVLEREVVEQWAESVAYDEGTLTTALDDNYQSEVTGACEAGAISDINPDGSVECRTVATTFTAEDARTAMNEINDDNPLNHARYRNAEARDAMGGVANDNTLNHARFSPADAVSAMDVQGDDNPLNHARYGDPEARGAMGGVANDNTLNHARFSPEDAVSAMDVQSDDNPLNHARYDDDEARAAMNSQSNDNPLNHARYDDDDARGAMGDAAIGNPLNHARYGDAEARAAMNGQSNDNPLNHARYDDDDARGAMGTHGDTNDYYHDRFTAANAVTAMGTRGNSNDLNHDRYTDGEAEDAIDGATIVRTGCTWTTYNDWDGVVNFACPNNGVVSAVYSYHDNGKEDRRFRYYCCQLRVDIP